jgi:hypothetical protein
MLIFKYKAKDLEALIEEIYIENCDMTIFFNDRKRNESIARTQMDLSRFLPDLGINNRPYRYIGKSDGEHKHMHDQISNKSPHHNHIRFEGKINAADIVDFIQKPNLFYEKARSIIGEYYLLKQNEIDDLVASFNAHCQSLEESNPTLDLQLSKNSSESSYLNRLEQTVGSTCLTYNNETNRYSLSKSWLKELGKNATLKELEKELNLDLSKYKPTNPFSAS